MYIWKKFLVFVVKYKWIIQTISILRIIIKWNWLEKFMKELNLGQSYQVGEVIPNAWKGLCRPPAVGREIDTGQSQGDKMFSCYSSHSVLECSPHCTLQLSYLVWWFSYLWIKTWLSHMYFNTLLNTYLAVFLSFKSSCQWLSIRELLVP